VKYVNLFYNPNISRIDFDLFTKNYILF